MLCCPECLTRARKPKSLIAEAVQPAALPPADHPRKWIDIHCHVFNLADLPVAEFIEHTRLQSGLALAAIPIIGLISAIFKGNAVTAQTELHTLAGNAPQPAQPPEQATTLDALRALHSDQPGFAPAMKNAAPLLHAALAELDPDHDTTAAITDARLQTLADHLDGDAAVNDPDYLAWIDLLTGARNDIVNALLAQFPPGDQVMLTPSLVDYNRWLGLTAADDTNLTPLPQQLAVTQAIATRHAAPAPPNGERRAAIGLFMPFDPWRSIETDQVLQDIQHALEQGLAIGVKLYPPMGFAALGNETLAENSFPHSLQTLVQTRRPTLTTGQALDAELRKLYALCEALDAPITTHVANSEIVDHPSSQLPSPQYWARALAAFPHLRVNLGHYGGVWRFATDSQDPDEIARVNEALAWSDQIAELMAQYPNVYADFAFFDLALENVQPGTKAARAIGHIHAQAARIPAVKQRLMFGSDWILVGMDAAGADYARRVMSGMNHFFQTPDEQDDIRWRNAARYLNLSPGTPTWQRLSRALGPHADILTQFQV